MKMRPPLTDEAACLLYVLQQDLNTLLPRTGEVDPVLSHLKKLHHSGASTIPRLMDFMMRQEFPEAIQDFMQGADSGTTSDRLQPVSGIFFFIFILNTPLILGPPV